MRKNLLYLLLFSLGNTFYQGHPLPPEARIEFFFTAPTNLNVINLSATSAKVIWDPVPGSTTYIVRCRPVGPFAWSSSPQIINDNEYILTGLQPCTSYEVQVLDVASGDWSQIASFNTFLNYCLSSSADSGLMHLSNVKITPSMGLPQMNSTSGASNYTDYRNDQSRKVQLYRGSVGNTITLSVIWPNVQEAVRRSGWIDFNGNGVFEVTEQIFPSFSSLWASAQVTFNVPANAYSGACGVLMRVMVSSTFNNNGCGSIAYGEVEDYTVNFIDTNLATNEIEKAKEVSIYPNPAEDLLNISGISSNIEYEIFTVLGQKVSVGKASGNAINVHHLEKGIYFIHLKDKENSTRMKFIKK